MKRIILAAIGAAAAAGLTACSSGATAAFGSGAAPASHKSASVPAPSRSPKSAVQSPPRSQKSAVRASANCRLQYSAWKHGHGKGLVATVTAISSAATAGDPQVLSAALQKARPAVASAARHPMPGCADPRGYWFVLLMHVNAAAAKGTSASSRRAALKGVPQIEHQLTTELKQTAR